MAHHAVAHHGAVRADGLAPAALTGTDDSLDWVKIYGTAMSQSGNDVDMVHGESSKPELHKAAQVIQNNVAEVRLLLTEADQQAKLTIV